MTWALFISCSVYHPHEPYDPFITNLIQLHNCAMMIHNVMHCISCFLWWESSPSLLTFCPWETPQVTMVCVLSCCNTLINLILFNSGCVSSSLWALCFISVEQCFMVQTHRKLEYCLQGTLSKVGGYLDILVAKGITCLVKTEKYQHLSIPLTKHLF